MVTHVLDLQQFYHYNHVSVSVDGTSFVIFSLCNKLLSIWAIFLFIFKQSTFQMQSRKWPKVPCVVSFSTFSQSLILKDSRG